MVSFIPLIILYIIWINKPKILMNYNQLMIKSYTINPLFFNENETIEILNKEIELIERINEKYYFISNHSNNQIIKPFKIKNTIIKNENLIILEEK